MEKNWKQVFLGSEEYQATMAHDILEENGIHSVIINHKDSAYRPIGDVEVYVNDIDVERAETLLKDLKS